MEKTDLLECLRGCRLPEWETLPDFGLYMDQLVTYVSRSLPGLSGRSELTSNMINNYVKAGLIRKPEGKKYSREALAQLLMISLMKPTTPLDVMKTLLYPVDGTGTEALYASFRNTQARIETTFGELECQSALSCALESSFLQLALRLKLQEEET